LVILNLIVSFTQLSDRQLHDSIQKPLTMTTSAVRNQFSIWVVFEKFIQKVNGMDIFKICVPIIAMLINVLFSTPAFAQNNKDSSALSLSSNEIIKQLNDYTRPGKYHQMLADLVGTWTFKGKRFPSGQDLFGTHIRKSFADGRYFVVDMTFGDSLHKIEIPIQDGTMKEVIGKGITIEGYDNVKKKFIQSYITNHIGSNIVYSEGDYNSTTNTITFAFEQELIPGMKDKIRELFTILDKDHYTLVYYHDENGTYIKDAEVNCTRVKEK
jgi:hypothetical protein